MTLNSLYSTNSFSCQYLRLVLSPLDFFYSSTTEIRFLSWPLQRKCFSKGCHDLVLDKWGGSFQVLSFYTYYLIRIHCHLAPWNPVLAWASTPDSLLTSLFLHWSLFFQNSIFDSCYTLTLNDFIYFLKNYKQIFISNPGLSLTLWTDLSSKCWSKYYIFNVKNLENVKNKN